MAALSESDADAGVPSDADGAELPLSDADGGDTMDTPEVLTDTDGSQILDFETNPPDDADGVAAELGGDVEPDADTPLQDIDTDSEPTPDVADGDTDTMPVADADADTTDTDTTPDTGPSVCGDSVCAADEEATCEEDCSGPRIVTVTAVINENDLDWFFALYGRSDISIERQESTGTWTRVGDAGDAIVAIPGQTYRVNSRTDSVDFGDCNVYTVPDDCTDCIYQAPRLVHNIERITYRRTPGDDRTYNFVSYCVSDTRITDAVRRDLGGCRGDGQVFNLAGSWVCLQPLGDLDGIDNLRGTVFGRCLSGDECEDYIAAEFQFNSTQYFNVTTTSETYSLVAYR